MSKPTKKPYTTPLPTKFTALFIPGCQQQHSFTKSKSAGDKDACLPSKLPCNSISTLFESASTFNDLSGQAKHQHSSDINSETSVLTTISTLQLPRSDCLLVEATANVESGTASQSISNQVPIYRVEIEVTGGRQTKFVGISADSKHDESQWIDFSSATNCIDMNSAFLKSLTVNPEVFAQGNGFVPYEWSRVVLLALYCGNDIHGSTNKSIWHSVLNNTAFAIVRPSVRRSAQNFLDVLQLRASKSKTINSSQNCQTNKVMPVSKVQIVHLSVRPERATMAKFLAMPDKVHIFAVTLIAHP